jgi:hypothetical protein
MPLDIALFMKTTLHNINMMKSNEALLPHLYYLIHPFPLNVRRNIIRLFPVITSATIN